jgi:hypothetical protein
MFTVYTTGTHSLLSLKAIGYRLYSDTVLLSPHPPGLYKDTPPCVHTLPSPPPSLPLSHAGCRAGGRTESRACVWLYMMTKGMEYGMTEVVKCSYDDRMHRVSYMG